MNFDTIVYHYPCSDGVGALWCANHYKDINEKIPCKAGYKPNLKPDNKTIIFVDLCPSFDILLELAKSAKSILILDHHKSALDSYNKNINNIPENVIYILDMSRSGCQITWDYFFPNCSTNCTTNRPWFIDYIADRDLWTWKLPDSKAINAELFDGDYIDNNNLDKMTELITLSTESINEFVKQGNLILRMQKKELDQSSRHAVEATMQVNGIVYNVWLGTCSGSLRSDLGNILANKPLGSGNLPDFSATWVYEVKSNEWWISLRGNDTSPDLSVICGYFGGGGHRMASGMTIKYPTTLRDIFLIK